MTWAVVYHLRESRQLQGWRTPLSHPWLWMFRPVGTKNRMFSQQVDRRLHLFQNQTLSWCLNRIYHYYYFLFSFFFFYIGQEMRMHSLRIYKVNMYVQGLNGDIVCSKFCKSVLNLWESSICCKCWTWNLENERLTWQSCWGESAHWAVVTVGTRTEPNNGLEKLPVEGDTVQLISPLRRSFFVLLFFFFSPQ